MPFSFFSLSTLVTTNLQLLIDELTGSEQNQMTAYAVELL